MIVSSIGGSGRKKGSPRGHQENKAEQNIGAGGTPPRQLHPGMVEKKLTKGLDH